jgi:hypothetical protein
MTKKEIKREINRCFSIPSEYFIRGTTEKQMYERKKKRDINKIMIILREV